MSSKLNNPVKLEKTSTQRTCWVEQLFGEVGCLNKMLICVDICGLIWSIMAQIEDVDHGCISFCIMIWPRDLSKSALNSHMFLMQKYIINFNDHQPNKL
jgi:hypothetical protein